MSQMPHNAPVRPHGSGELARSLAVQPNLDDDPFDSRPANAKRRKTEASGPVSMMANLRGRISATFDTEMGDSVQKTLTHMADALHSRAGLQDELSVCAALQFLSQTLCVIDHKASLADPDDHSSAIMCGHCSTPNPTTALPPHREKDRDDAACAFRLFQDIATRMVPQTGQLMVRTLILLRRMALHAATDTVLDYNHSTLCKWASTQLYSPDRAVRIQAGYVYRDVRNLCAICVLALLTRPGKH